MSSALDHEVMLQVRDGDVGRLEVLFGRYQKALFHFFLRLTADGQTSEDLVQEVFVRILKYRHTYRQESEFTTWMYQIARNVRFDHYKKRKREVALEEERGNSHVSREPLAIDRLERRQAAELLRAALERLPDDKREILILSRYQDLRYRQIASILCCEVGTVKVRVYRALKELSHIYFELSSEKAS